jgi:hypothetical protein
LKLATAAAAAATLTFSVAPSFAATTWDVVADYAGNANTGSSVWQYGSSQNSVFTRFTVQNTACIISSGLNCWQSTNPQFFVPLVAMNTTASTLFYANSVVHPNNVLNLHPGGSQNGSMTGGDDIDTVVRFTAQTGGSYSFNGFFQALDTNPTGVRIKAGGNAVNISGSALQNTLQPGAPTNFAFNSLLAQGDTVDFVVNRLNNYGNDSTGLSLSVALVPEPATWAMMIIGFGAAGSMIRRRRAVAA